MSYFFEGMLSGRCSNYSRGWSFLSLVSSLNCIWVLVLWNLFLWRMLIFMIWNAFSFLCLRWRGHIIWSLRCFSSWGTLLFSDLISSRIWSSWVQCCIVKSVWNMLNHWGLFTNVLWVILMLGRGTIKPWEITYF